MSTTDMGDNLDEYRTCISKDVVSDLIWCMVYCGHDFRCYVHLMHTDIVSFPIDIKLGFQRI